MRLKWLLIALQEDAGDIPAVFNQWKLWMNRNCRAVPISEQELQEYYVSPGLMRDFLDFLHQEYRSRNSKILAPLAEFARDMVSGRSGSHSAEELRRLENHELPESIPVLSRNTSVFTSEIDGLALIDTLRGRRTDDSWARRKRTFAVITDDRDFQTLFPLSLEAEAILEFSDGVSTFAECMWRIHSQQVPLDRAAMQAHGEALRWLEENGVIHLLPCVPETREGTSDGFHLREGYVDSELRQLRGNAV
jgi:hypothetical protein